MSCRPFARDRHERSAWVIARSPIGFLPAPTRFPPFFDFVFDCVSILKGMPTSHAAKGGLWRRLEVP
jgi:hypothetical protein